VNLISKKIKTRIKLLFICIYLCNFYVFSQEGEYIKIENFIFLSSSNVYEEKNIFSEQDKIWSKNYYGKNKIIIENFLKKKKFKSLIVLRLFDALSFIFPDSSNT